jgi:hypothetical protein
METNYVFGGEICDDDFYEEGDDELDYIGGRETWEGGGQKCKGIAAQLLCF